MIPNIPLNGRWAQNGVTIAGGHGDGNATNQLFYPQALSIDEDDQVIFIADSANNRIVQWKIGDTNGQVVVDTHGQGNALNQLIYPSDLLIDKATDSLIICDQRNDRILKWSRHLDITQEEIIVDNIECFRLAMDDQRYLYVSLPVEHEVRQYKVGDKYRTVAGGHGNGAEFNQLSFPTHLFVDRIQNIYVLDAGNNRVMKWITGAKEGVVVARGQGEGNALGQSSYLSALFVDMLGTVYVADAENHQVVRWTKGAGYGEIIVDGNHKEEEKQLNFSVDFSFDRLGQLYVVDYKNHRIQRFSVE